MRLNGGIRDKNCCRPFRKQRSVAPRGCDVTATFYLRALSTHLPDSHRKQPRTTGFISCGHSCTLCALCLATLCNWCDGATWPQSWEKRPVSELLRNLPNTGRGISSQPSSQVFDLRPASKKEAHELLSVSIVVNLNCLRTYLFVFSPAFCGPNPWYLHLPRKTHHVFCPPPRTRQEQERRRRVSHPP